MEIILNEAQLADLNTELGVAKLGTVGRGRRYDGRMHLIVAGRPGHEPYAASVAVLLAKIAVEAGYDHRTVASAVRQLTTWETIKVEIAFTDVLVGASCSICKRPISGVSTLDETDLVCDPCGRDIVVKVSWSTVTTSDPQVTRGCDCALCVGDPFFSPVEANPAEDHV